jgi:signal transduction histidine kinase/ligand-binding sensor domain-containing protein/CheY-like chemotaxis protein
MNKKRITALSAVLLLAQLCSFTARGEDTPFVFSDSELTSQLSQATAREIYQDSYGYVWVLTQEGLNRFDGRNNKIFRSDVTSATSVSHDSMRGIVEDEQGNLWIGTAGGGLNRYDRTDETFLSILSGPDPLTTPYSDKVWSLTKGRDGKLWVGYKEGGFSVFHPSTGLFKHYTPQRWPDITTHSVTAIFEAEDGVVWVGTDGNGLLRLDVEEELVESYARPAFAPHNLASDRISDIHIDRAGNFWVSFWDLGVAKSSSGSEFVNVDEIFNTPELATTIDEAHSIFEDNKGRIFVATPNGVALFHPDKDSFQLFTVDNSGLAFPRVLSITQDRTDRYWIGSYQGVNVGFETSFYTYNASAGLLDETVLSMAVGDSGAPWIGTAYGLYEFGSDLSAVKIDLSSDQLNASPISSLLIDGDFVWAGVYTRGLVRYTRSTGEVKVFSSNGSDSSSLSQNRVTRIYKDSYGNIWVGTYRGGLNLLRPGAEKFERFSSSLTDLSSISSDTIYALYQERNGDLWIGTENGLNRYNYDLGSFDRFLHDRGRPTSLSSAVIYDIYEDDEARMWIGTEAGGLNLWEPIDRKRSIDRFEHFQRNIDLPSSTVYAIEGDDHGNLWFSTSGGITRFDYESFSYKHFTVNDGLQANEFNLGASFTDERGRLYFGGTKGFNAFMPDEIKDNSVLPPVELTRVSIVNKQVFFDDPYSDLSSVSLESDDYMVGFEFAALDFISPRKNLYRYQMVGLDKSWIELGNKNTVDFTNLPTGEYIFRVSASNADGLWNEDGISVQVTVNPPWYATWLAFFTYISLGVIVSLNWMRHLRSKEYEQMQYRVRLETDVRDRTFDLKTANAKLQNAVEQIGTARQEAVAANQAKSEFLAALSHEIRTPMHGVLGMTDLLMHSGLQERQSEFAESAHRSATELLGLIDNILDFSKIEAGKIELEETTFNLREVMENLCYLYGEMAQAKDVELNLIFKATLNRQMYGDPVRLRQIMQNLLSNAIKFTKRGSVTVSVEEVQRADKTVSLRFCVEDTGIGMDEEALGHIFEAFSQADSSTTRQYGGTGLGLSIARQLVSLMEGELEVQSRVGMGTTMVVTLSLDESPIYTDKLATAILEPYYSEVVAPTPEGRAMLSSQMQLVNSKVRECLTVTEVPVRADHKRIVLIDVGSLFEDADLAQVMNLQEDLLTEVMLVAPLDLRGIPPELSRLAHTTKPCKSATLIVDLLSMIAPGTEERSVVDSPVMRYQQKVLLVEDMAANQEIARAMLESFGCSVDLAANGSVALEMYQSESYDIVLMDCQMPVMDGFEATRHIRRLDASRTHNQRIPVVAVTAGKAEVEKDRCYAAGMDRILFKPYSTAELNVVLSHYFDATGTIEAVQAVPAQARLGDDILDMKTLESIRSVETQTGNPLLPKVYENFSRDAAEKIRDLRTNLTNSKELGSGAHAIASMSLNLGAKALTIYSRKLEANWKNGLIDDAAREIEVLQGHLQDALRALEPIVNEGIQELEN